MISTTLRRKPHPVNSLPQQQGVTSIWSHIKRDKFNKYKTSSTILRKIYRHTSMVDVQTQKVLAPNSTYTNRNKKIKKNHMWIVSKYYSDGIFAKHDLAAVIKNSINMAERSIIYRNLWRWNGCKVVQAGPERLGGAPYPILLVSISSKASLVSCCPYKICIKPASDLDLHRYWFPTKPKPSRKIRTGIGHSIN